MPDRAADLTIRGRADGYELTPITPAGMRWCDIQARTVSSRRCAVRERVVGYRQRRWAAVAAFVVVIIGVATPGIAQTRATVLTKKGETIEGVFKGATETEVIIELAGQQLRLPTASLNYVSFTGKVAEEPKPGVARPIDEAFKALAELDAATEIGVLRDQYSAKLLSTLPRVLDFIKTGPGWGDVRLLMTQAVETYKQPLASLDSWKYGSASFTGAAEYVKRARALASAPNEESHIEDRAEREVKSGVSVSGRLGTGDQEMPSYLDRGTAGAFNDVYQITIESPLTLALTMTAVGCRAHLTLADASGKQLAGNKEGFDQTGAVISKALKPGVYKIWAGAAAPGEIGTYTLRVFAYQ